MPSIRIETAIAASPERCFDLARDVGAHVRSTKGTDETPVAGVTMRHLHEFVPRDSGTTMVDTFSFTSPLGPLGAIFDRLFLAGYLRRFLLSRAAALKGMAESAR